MIALDLGSNTLRCIEYDAQKWGRRMESIVGTAEELAQTGRIGPKALERILTALTSMRGCTEGVEVRACATAALRQASNQAAIIEVIYAHTGISFEVISPQEEGRLTLRAVRHRLRALGYDDRSLVMVDIGGGSIECVYVEDEMITSLSYPLGILTALDASSEQMDDLIAWLQSHRRAVSHLVMSSGTPTSVVAFLQGMHYHDYDATQINGRTLRYEELIEASSGFGALSVEELIQYVGLGREHVIQMGITLMGLIYRHLGFEEAIVIDDGLREGIALAFFEGDSPANTSRS